MKYNVSEFIDAFSGKTKDNEFLDDKVSIAGRITNIRQSGKNLVFYDVMGNGKRVQVFCNAGNHKGKQSF